MTSPGFNLAALNVIDSEPIKITRKRKPRELSPLGKYLTETHKSKKSKTLTLGNMDEAQAVVRVLRADVKQLGIGLGVHIGKPDARTGKVTVQFQGQDKRGYTKSTTQSGA